MSARWTRLMRGLMLIGSGSLVFQAGGCSPVTEFLQTGLLGAITGLLYYLSRNV